MPIPEKKPPAGGKTSQKAVASLVLGLLSFCFALLTGIPAIVLGALALADISSSRGRLGGQALAIVGLCLGALGTLMTCILPALLLPAVQAAREAARRMQSSNYMMNIGVAMHNYHDVYKSFPPAGSEDPQHGLGLSWRVRILPMIGEDALFRKFNFNEPWNSPTNQALVDQMPEIYRSPNQSGDPGTTVYLAVVRPAGVPRDQAMRLETCFNREPPFDVRIADITDGTTNTILVVEADESEAVIWTRPSELEYDVQDPWRGLGRLRPRGFNAVFADGRVEFISRDRVSDETLKGLFTRSGNEVLDLAPGEF